MKRLSESELNQIIKWDLGNELDCPMFTIVELVKEILELRRMNEKQKDIILGFDKGTANG